jgi:hypothetical protein
VLLGPGKKVGRTVFFFSKNQLSLEQYAAVIRTIAVARGTCQRPVTFFNDNTKVLFRNRVLLGQSDTGNDLIMVLARLKIRITRGVHMSSKQRLV